MKSIKLDTYISLNSVINTIQRIRLPLANYQDSRGIPKSQYVTVENPGIVTKIILLIESVTFLDA